MNRKPLTLLSLSLLSLSFTAQAREFALGADISGTTMDESRGQYSYTTDGVQTENTLLMKQYGMNAVRLRVWVDPRGGWSSKEDVLVMARRAKAQGMDIMIDFHYSDWWADPNKQNIPAAWKDLDLDGMRKALADHTMATLKLLKDNDIDVKWVQVGNETRDGFLWPMGQISAGNTEQYALLTQSGYDAVKAIYPQAKVIIHIDNGFDAPLYDSIFDALASYGTKWDIIGMSVYPFWAIDGKYETTAEQTLEDAIDNIRHLKAKYGTDVMIVEVGVDANFPQEGKIFMDALFDAAIFGTGGACTGVFYWAPEANAEGGYKLGAFQKSHPTEILDSYPRAAGLLKPLLTPQE